MIANLDKIVIIDKIGDNAKILYDNNFKPVYQHNQLNELFKSREKIYKNLIFIQLYKKLISIFENIKDLISSSLYFKKSLNYPKKNYRI